jgi:hypothetical protein
MYADIFRRLRDAGRRKGREKWSTNSWFLLDNAAAHQSILVKDFLAKNNDNAAASSIPNLAAADFYLVPGLKSAFLTLLTL